MAEGLPEEIIKTLESYHNPPNKLRTWQEITARYKLALENYKNICFMSGDVREQKVATHAEIRTLGWVLGKPEKNIVKDIVDNSNNPGFPPQI